VNTPKRDDPRSETVLRVELTWRTALVGLVTLSAVWLLFQLWQILLVIVVALMLVGMLHPFVERLEARGLRRGLAITLVFGTLSVVFAGFSALTLPRLLSQVAELAADFPKSQAYLATRLESAKLTAPLATSVRSVHLGMVAQKAQEYGMTYGPKAVEIFAYTLTALFLALYIIIDRDRMRGALFAVVPRAFHVRLSRVVWNLETIVGGYMRGQVITSALMGAFTLVVLLIAGVPNALPLALFAALADVLPYVGALLACGPAFLAALSQGTTVAVVVLMLLAAYQELESRVIVPRIYGKVLRLPAATVMISLLVGGKLLGIVGALLALPIAAGIRMVVEELRVALPGEDIDDSAVRAGDARAEAEFETRAAGAPAAEAAKIATEIAEHRRADEAEAAEAVAGEEER
jgi:putative heme transporter